MQLRCNKEYAIEYRPMIEQPIKTTPLEATWHDELLRPGRRRKGRNPFFMPKEPCLRPSTRDSLVRLEYPPQIKAYTRMPCGRRKVIVPLSTNFLVLGMLDYYSIQLSATPTRAWSFISLLKEQIKLIRNREKERKIKMDQKRLKQRVIQYRRRKSYDSYLWDSLISMVKLYTQKK